MIVVIWCCHVRRSVQVCDVMLQNALNNFPFKNHFNCFKIVFFFAASRLLGTAAACVILLSFAAGHRKSYWSGCIKAAILICQQIFSILARIIFLLKIILKLASKSSFFRFGVEIRLWSVFADRIVMAASRLLGTAAACVILLSFAAGHRKSYWSGCIKAAILICQQIFSILARIIFLLYKNHFKNCFEIVFFSLWRRDPVVASLCRSHCNGCVKVAWHGGCMRNTIVFCSWTS